LVVSRSRAPVALAEDGLYSRLASSPASTERYRAVWLEFRVHRAISSRRRPRSAIRPNVVTCSEPPRRGPTKFSTTSAELSNPALESRHPTAWATWHDGARKNYQRLQHPELREPEYDRRHSISAVLLLDAGADSVHGAPLVLKLPPASASRLALSRCSWRSMRSPVVLRYLQLKPV
jgi:hypothetical protein